MKNTYQHFCPAARALEVIGEKWSLLIVRDLLRGPKRFNDLRRLMDPITSKWLSARLRELEEAGIVERDAAGQREVWYGLTQKGRDLSPVVEALAVWGIDYALRPPLPGEAIHPGQATTGFVTYLNRRGVTLPQPVTWVVRLGTERGYTIRFDGNQWFLQRGEQPADIVDVVIETTPEAWVRFLSSQRDERREQLREMVVEGAPARAEELAETLGRRQAEPEPEPSAGAQPV
jgi:DNA-binding HxlR family transcriptional regulator